MYKGMSLLKFFTHITFLSFFTITAIADNLMSLSDRKDRWELSFQTRYFESIDLEFEGGASASLNEDINWAIGLGYNYSEHWAFNFDMGWGDAGYSGTRIDDNDTPESVSGNIYTSSMNFGTTYNFLAKRFTPFVGASVGWTFVDTNIPDGLPQTVCWYDPWWGYVCDTFIPTKTTTELTYGAIAGLRFDVNDQLFLKGSAGKQWIDFGKTTGSTPDFIIYRLDIGVMF
ncbi:MAG: hypothetical protein DIZ80_11505 [endosymbiont of Galathealinum brachiosum]|uniref:Outer membrane protein beta-barrel domain-containing protein n=1 Tax=endosymbiont of Galathealinum brachiosum TaxID=2200906 RepID=A0A370DF05_9GAMM|nr:MAG: hypothetical protein DIZ80_11505 [endosymbiont of Galathealinum brachiosum]